METEKDVKVNSVADVLLSNLPKEVITEDIKNKVISSIDEIVKKRLDEQKVVLEKEFNDKKTAFETEIKTKMSDVSSEVLKEEIAKREKDMMEVVDEVVNSSKEIISEYKNTVVEKIDEFLDVELDNRIPKEVMENAAKASLYAPIIEGVEKLFIENLRAIKIDKTGKDAIDTLTNKLNETKKALDTTIEEKINIKKSFDVLSKKVAIEEAVKGLTEDQKKQAMPILEACETENIAKKMDEVRNTIITSEVKKSDDVKVLNEGKKTETPTKKVQPRRTTIGEVGVDILNTDFSKLRELTEKIVVGSPKTVITEEDEKTRKEREEKTSKDIMDLYESTKGLI